MSGTGRGPHAASAIRRCLARSQLLLELGDSLLELFHPFFQRRQVAEHHRRLPPAGVLDCRMTGDERTGADRLQDGALRPDHRALSDADVAGHAGLTRHHDVVLDDGAAGDADLRGEQRAAADRYAVRDVHEVVDLRSRANPRLADRRTIDRRVRANLHIVLDDDAGMLRNLQMRAVLLPREPETVAADDDPVVQRDAIADDDALANGRLGVNDAARANPRARADHDVGEDDRACADRRAGADRDEWPDRHLGAY